MSGPIEPHSDKMATRALFSDRDWVRTHFTCCVCASPESACKRTTSSIRLKQRKGTEHSFDLLLFHWDCIEMRLIICHSQSYMAGALFHHCQHYGPCGHTARLWSAWLLWLSWLNWKTCCHHLEKVQVTLMSISWIITLWLIEPDHMLQTALADSRELRRVNC